MQTVFADFLATVVYLGLQEGAFLAVGAKPCVFQLLQDCFDVCEFMFVVGSCDEDVGEDAVRIRNPLQKLWSVALLDSWC